MQGMLLTGFEFGFFPIAGWLGLLGMIIKNVIVLIDEINVQHRQGIDLYHFHHRSDGIPNPTGTDGSHNDHFRHGPPIIRYRLPRYGGHHYFRTDFRHLIDLIVTPVLYVLFYKVKEKRV